MLDIDFDFELPDEYELIECIGVHCSTGHQIQDVNTFKYTIHKLAKKGLKFVTIDDDYRDDLTQRAMIGELSPKMLLDSV